ncbi:MAG: lysylphosphatidylglycerol synthase transmembrane domain-containing protein [Gaiellales bacterium]
MRSFLDATESFWDSLSDIAWSALGIAIGCHLLKLCSTSRAWRNVLAAAYPGEKVRWRKIFAAYVSGVGINAIIPARAGDVVRVVLAHRAIPGSSYTTVVSSTAVLSLVDMACALLVFGWALTQNVLPSIDVLPELPTFDYGWFLDHRRFSAALGVVLLVLLVLGLIWVRRRWRELRARVAQAFTVMRPPRRYVRTVVFWQLADWALRLTVIWFFLGAFGIHQSIRNVLLVQATQSLATLVPATPGGIGTEQAFILYAFRNAGIARSTLLAFSVGMRLTLTVVNVVVGFAAVLLTLGTLRFRSAAAPPPDTEPVGD